jgi:hypothetical protein
MCSTPTLAKLCLIIFSLNSPCISGNNERSHKTKNAATKHRINTELKFLYKKKSTLHQLLYNTHLDCANYWKEMWFLIERSEHQKFQIMNDILYNKLNKKLDHLRSECLECVSSCFARVCVCTAICRCTCTVLQAAIFSVYSYLSSLFFLLCRPRGSNVSHFVLGPRGSVCVFVLCLFFSSSDEFKNCVSHLSVVVVQGGDLSVVYVGTYEKYNIYTHTTKKTPPWTTTTPRWLRKFLTSSLDERKTKPKSYETCEAEFL